ncbi:MAG: hypothetical protein QM759_17480 [Terricaulis sp.]
MQINQPLSLLAAGIAAAAAVASTWIAWQTMQQTRTEALLDRRVNACFETDQRAAHQIAAAMNVQRAMLDAGDQTTAHMQRDVTQFLNWANDPHAAAARIDEQVAAEEFDAAKQFDLLGPASVARAEQDLGAKLNQMSDAVKSDEGTRYQSAIQSAQEARRAFRQACRDATLAYR